MTSPTLAGAMLATHPLLPRKAGVRLAALAFLACCQNVNAGIANTNEGMSMPAVPLAAVYGMHYTPARHYELLDRCKRNGNAPLEERTVGDTVYAGCGGSFAANYTISADRLAYARASAALARMMAEAASAPLWRDYE